MFDPIVFRVDTKRLFFKAKDLNTLVVVPACCRMCRILFHDPLQNGYSTINFLITAINVKFKFLVFKCSRTV